MPACESEFLRALIVGAGLGLLVGGGFGFAFAVQKCRELVAMLDQKP